MSTNDIRKKKCLVRNKILCNIWYRNKRLDCNCNGRISTVSLWRTHMCVLEKWKNLITFLHLLLHKNIIFFRILSWGSHLNLKPSAIWVWYIYYDGIDRDQIDRWNGFKGKRSEWRTEFQLSCLTTRPHTLAGLIQSIKNRWNNNGYCSVHDHLRDCTNIKNLQSSTKDFPYLL